MKMYRGKMVPENYEELCDIWDSYYNKNKTYPNSNTCNNDSSLPSWSRVKQICGDRYNEFLNKYKIGKPSVKNYTYYCEMIIQLANELGRTPTIREIRESNKGIPEYRWMVKNYPHKDITSFNELLNEIGLKSNYFVTKEYATKCILEKLNNQNGVIKADDFDNPSSNEIGHGTIKRLWGTFNNMLKDLNIPLNRIGASTLSKPLEELEDDIKKLCEYLYTKNGHKHISLSDINECEWCSSHGTYNRVFLKEFNMTIGEYISSIGYIPNNEGMGMMYKFEDGEVTKSKYEYIYSKFLKDNDIKYTRNVKYSELIDYYNGNKDCDYVINLNGRLIYVEIAGMLKDVKSFEHAETLKLQSIQQRYLKELKIKQEMLDRNNLEYYILFPHQFSDVDFLFSETITEKIL